MICTTIDYFHQHSLEYWSVMVCPLRFIAGRILESSLTPEAIAMIDSGIG